MNKSYTVIFDNTANTLIDMFSDLGVPSTRTAIRNTIFTHPSYPNLNLKDINDVLKKWNVTPCIVKADKDTLPRLDPPFLSWHAPAASDSGHPVGYTLVSSLEGGKVGYKRNRALRSLQLDEFCSNWSGYLVLFDREQSGREENFEANLAEEKKVHEEYARSIRMRADFFTPEECSYIISYAEQHNLFNQSEVNYGGKGKPDTHLRSSYSAYLTDREDTVFDAIYERAAAWAGVEKSDIEDLQCVRYACTQEFKMHFDTDDTIIRKSTMLVYLNDDYVGGETYFPEIDYRVHPKKGSCVWFLNRDEAGEVLIGSLHAGMPVQEGVKYACNIWIRK
jgi:hypothetical protein